MPRMKQIHKWVSLAVGVVFLMWVVSGVVMVLPGTAHPTTLPPEDPAPVYQRAGLSPAQLMARLGMEDATADLREIRLRVILDTLLYEVRGAGRTFLVSADDGSRYVIDSTRATRLAGALLPGLPIRTTHRLRSYARDYQEGPLPVWEVQFGDRGATRAWVSDQGTVVRIADDTRRIREAIGGLHVFRPLRRLSAGESGRRAALMGAALVCLVTIGTGYYLAWPWRRRQSGRRL